MFFIETTEILLQANIPKGFTIKQKMVDYFF